jgi:hypothetical protein
MVLIEYVPPGPFDSEQTRVFWQNMPDYEMSHDQIAPGAMSKIRLNY